MYLSEGHSMTFSPEGVFSVTFAMLFDSPDWIVKK
jgi:hypothetical protein